MMGPDLLTDPDGRVLTFRMPEPLVPGGWRVDVYPGDRGHPAGDPLITLRGASIAEQPDRDRAGVTTCEIVARGRRSWTDDEGAQIAIAALELAVIGRGLADWPTPRVILHAYMAEPAVVDYSGYTSDRTYRYWPRHPIPAERTDRLTLPERARLVTITLTAEPAQVDTADDAAVDAAAS